MGVAFLFALGVILMASLKLVLETLSAEWIIKTLESFTQDQWEVQIMIHVSF